MKDQEGLTTRHGHTDGSGDAEYVAALRGALLTFDATGSPCALNQAFVAAAASVAVLRGNRATQRIEANEARWLMVELPEFRRFVAAAAGEAEQSAHAGARELWDWFGLSSAAPSWDEQERSAARMLIACSCAPLEQGGPDRLRVRLLRLASERWAGRLTDELSQAPEQLWQRSLGERYRSVHARYAPRTRWRKLQLSHLIASDERITEALHKRLARWLADGCDYGRLSEELEAAFVEIRAPANVA